MGIISNVRRISICNTLIHPQSKDQGPIISRLTIPRAPDRKLLRPPLHWPPTNHKMATSNEVFSQNSTRSARPADRWRDCCGDVDLGSWENDLFSHNKQSLGSFCQRPLISVNTTAPCPEGGGNSFAMLEPSFDAITWMSNVLINLMKIV